MYKKLWPFGVALVALVAVATTAYAAPLESWDTKIKGKTRFVVLKDFASQAVLDLETQLVWERAPSAELRSWDDAQRECHNLQVGGRFGWRMPTIEELTSLLDNTNSNPALPDGHPFEGIRLNPSPLEYWSATTTAGITEDAEAVSFSGSGNIDNVDKVDENPFWCVRGGQGYDANDVTKVRTIVDEDGNFDPPADGTLVTLECDQPFVLIDAVTIANEDTSNDDQLSLEIQAQGFLPGFVNVLVLPPTTTPGPPEAGSVVGTNGASLSVGLPNGRKARLRLLDPMDEADGDFIVIWTVLTANSAICTSD